MEQLDLLADPRHHWRFQELQAHIVENFFKFHRDNPHVYELFKKFASEARAAGRDYFGASLIVERMRWYTMIETKGEEFKLNNNYTSCYARLLMVEDPGYEMFFQTRVSPGQVAA